MLLIVAVLCSYLIGSIPMSNIIAQRKGTNLLKFGSGNPGATNLIRAAGPFIGALGIIADALKGALPVAICWHYLSMPTLECSLVGLAAVFGHIFSVFIGFKGGKGVATSGGVFMIFHPIPTVIAVAVWLMVVLITKYSSLGSLLAVAAFFLAQLSYSKSLSQEMAPVFVLSLVVIAIIVTKHKSNIGRLRSGSESKL